MGVTPHVCEYVPRLPRQFSDLKSCSQDALDACDELFSYEENLDGGMTKENQVEIFSVCELVDGSTEKNCEVQSEK